MELFEDIDPQRLFETGDRDEERSVDVSHNLFNVILYNACMLIL